MAYMFAVLVAAALGLSSRGGPPPTSPLSRAAVLRHAASVGACVATAGIGIANAVPPPDMIARELEQRNAPAVLYTPPSIKGMSSPDQLALAEHLKSKGAKFYGACLQLISSIPCSTLSAACQSHIMHLAGAGAYWCRYCYEQRSMFGASGSRALPYVECAADGFQSASATCRAKKEVTGYPTWEIDGKFYGGMRTLSDLQSVSGFNPSVKFAEYVPPPPPPPPPRPPTPPGGFRLPPVETTSNAEQLALARHLKATGAKFYGAYWCGYCKRQRVLFGADAASALPYVECAADGFQSASATCRAKKEVTGYPTWEIDGKFYGGMQSIEELSRLSGFAAAKSGLAWQSPSPTPAGGTSVPLKQDDPGCTVGGGDSMGTAAADCP